MAIRNDKEVKLAVYWNRWVNSWISDLNTCRGDGATH